MHNQPSEMVLLAYPDRFFTSPGWTGIRSRATLPPSPVHASRSASDGDLPRAHRTARPPGPLRRVRAPRRRVARPAAGGGGGAAPPPRGGAGGGLALRVLQAACVVATLAAATYKVFELDRFFVPKELVLHLAALLSVVLCLG